MVPEAATCKRGCSLRHPIVAAQEFLRAFPRPAPCGPHGLGVPCLQRHARLPPTFAMKTQRPGHSTLL